jgi:hypothetical protein
MPHTIVPGQPIHGRELELIDPARTFWNLIPTALFQQTFPNCVLNNHRVALIQKEQRAGQGFNQALPGAGGIPIGPRGALNARSFSLQLPFAIDPRFADVLTAFNALGIAQIPHAVPGMQGFTSPCAGGPFYGTVPHNYQNNSMSLPDILKFFKDLGFKIQIDTGYNQGPVQNGLSPHVWAAVCAL